MNPVLNKKTFENVAYGNYEVMTINGVVNKSFILWLILAVGAYLGWNKPGIMIQLIIPICIVSIALAFFMVFKKRTVSLLAPFYAFGEGLLLGTLTVIFEKKYPGIAFNAVFLTISVLFCMLAAFKSGIIKVTNKFRFIVSICTISIFLLYFAELMLSLFGVTGFTFIYYSGPWGIAFSVFVVIIASLNLILDFDLIQQGIAMRAPKNMEWYCAFALMVTIVWLYMEILRLLIKLRE